MCKRRIKIKIKIDSYLLISLRDINKIMQTLEIIMLDNQHLSLMINFISRLTTAKQKGEKRKKRGEEKGKRMAR